LLAENIDQDRRREGDGTAPREGGGNLCGDLGANAVAALQVAERLGPGAKVVTLMADSGLKYLNTDVYKNI
jgi:cysteine synthase A